MSAPRRFPSDDTRRSMVNQWKNESLRRAKGPMGKILGGMAITLSIVVVAACGYRLHGWSWQDSFYMVTITIFGIGYEETRPVDSTSLRWLTISLIVTGYVAIIYTVGGFAQLLIDGELKKVLGSRRMQRDIDRLEKHVVICGFGRMGSALAQALASRGKPFVVIDQSADSVEQARQHGCLAIQGNATEELLLKKAGVERAAVLATVLSDDVSNLFITITAHQLNEGLEILARAEQSSTIKKLRQVGASKVILPANIGADRLANMILRPTAESLLQDAQLPAGLNDDLASLGLRLDELEVQAGSSLIGGTIADICVESSHAFLIVALRRIDGEVILNPTQEEGLAQGDCVVILAQASEIPALCARYALLSELHDSVS